MKIHPQQHFIFGYGSLLCAHSRAVTCPDHALVSVIPVVVQGIERVWSKRTNFMTAMGVRFNVHASTVGILLPVSSQDIKAFDQREQGYDRIELNLSNVQCVPFLNKEEHYQQQLSQVFLDVKERNAKHRVKIWVYVPKESRFPTKQFPIVQSYVDTILRGCLSVGGEEFAKEFIQSTKGWHPEEQRNDGSHVVVTSNQDVMERSSIHHHQQQQQQQHQQQLQQNHCLSHSMGNDTKCSVWMNDRSRPVYPRADPVYLREFGSMLDALLEKYIPPKYFFNRTSMEHHGTRKRPPKVQQ